MGALFYTSQTPAAPSTRACKFAADILDKTGAEVPGCRVEFAYDWQWGATTDPKLGGCVLKPQDSYVLAVVLESWQEDPLTHRFACGVSLDHSPLGPDNDSQAQK